MKTSRSSTPSRVYYFSQKFCPCDTLSYACKVSSDFVSPELEDIKKKLVSTCFKKPVFIILLYNYRMKQI